MSSLPSSAAAVAAAASQRQEQEEVKYEVLYYERKNKVHKSKGVSKFDGILSIAVTSGYIRLQDTAATADNDSSDDDSEEEDAKLRGKAKEKQRRKHHQQQRKSKPVPYSGRDKALAQKCCDLQDDETIVLGGYEVQIVSSMKAAKPKTASGLLAHKRSVTNNNTLIRKRPNSLLGNSNGSIGSNAPTGGLKRGGGPLLSTTRKVLPKPLVSSIKSNTTTTTTKNNKNALPLARTIPPNTTNNTNGNNNPLSNRMIVAKPLVRRTVGGTSLAMRKQPPKQPQNGNKENNSNGIAPTTTANNINICPHIPMPASLRTVLRPHQVQGVEFLWNALTEGPQRGCILADEMGLGKTLMTITVICGMFRKQRDKHFIVVCPSSLVPNWAKEFDKWIGKTSQPKRVVIQKGDADNISRLKSVYSSTKSMGGQVLILSYELFRRVTEHFTHNIGLLVVDEGHRLKNQDGLTINALEALPCEARLCITATPVQNNLREFFNLANFVRPGCLGEWAEFRKEYERPITAMNQKNASREQKWRGQEQSKALDSLIKLFMLRRLQKDVLKAMLPPRTEVLLFCRPTTVQCQMYEKLCRGHTASSMSTEALTTLTKLRKLCSHPFLVGEKAGENNGKKVAGEDYVSLSGKLIVLQGLLRSIREQGDKVVIVSNFTSALSLIESTILEPQKVPFCRLDGSTDQSERSSMVDMFNRPNSSVFAFLLSSKAGGCGLNLIGANRLIMYDADWNPATDTQAMARVYRQGQTKPCHIYRLFTSGTVEEVILQRQISKGSLAVFDGTKSNEKFTKDELADCFTLKDCKCDTKRKLGKSWIDYHGPESLEAQGSVDDALSYVAEHDGTCDIVSFIHLVEDKEQSTVVDDEADNDEWSSEEEVKKRAPPKRPAKSSISDESSDEEKGKLVRKMPAKKQSLIDEEAEEASFEDEEDDDESSDEEMEF